MIRHRLFYLYQDITTHISTKGGKDMSSRGKQKLLLAVGERQLEHFIKAKMSNEFDFTKEASYREIVIKRIREERPDVVLLREALKGSMSIESLVLDIRENYPEVRVVFYTSKNRPGEPLLRRLVSYGVYDLIGGESITEAQIFNGLVKPKQLSDVRQYLDAPTIESDEPPMMVTAEYIDMEEKEKEQPVNLPPINKMEPEKDNTKEVETETEKNKESGLFGRLFGRNKKKDKDDSEEHTQPDEYIDERKKEPVIESDKKDSGGYHNPLELFGSNKDTNNNINESLEVEPTEEESDISFEDINIPDIEFSADWLDEKTGDEDISEEINPEPIVKPIPLNKSPDRPVVERTVQEPTREKEPDDRLTLQARGKPKEAEDGIQIIKERDESYNKPPIEINEKENKTNRGWLGSKKDNGIRVKSNQIITFVSAVHGVGNTHIAFNTALKLADEGNRVLYIDMNSSFSSVDFSFQLGTWQQGIDKALEDIEYNSGMNASDNIIRMKDVKIERKEDKQLQELYKSLPDTLDYLFYSLDYQTLEKQHPVPKDRIRDLIMYLMTRERYDVVIIDSEPLGTEGVDGLLNLSNKIYFTMTQDPGQMGVFHRQFDAAKKRVNITDERYIIVNQFVDVEPKAKRIQKWTNEEVLQTVPFTHKSVILANFLGEPFILKTKHKDAIEAFDVLARHLAK